MYAVIRTGGKQYKVAPGDVIRIERLPSDDGSIEFSDVLAVSGEPGVLSRPGSATVTGTVVEEGRGDKIIVFHFKRKKQYKKLNGHRQPFTAVRIAEITVDGQSFKAPEVSAKPTREKKLAAGEAKTGPRAMKADATKRAVTGAQGA